MNDEPLLFPDAGATARPAASDEFRAARPPPPPLPPSVADGAPRALEREWIAVEMLAGLARAALLVGILVFGWSIAVLSGAFPGPLALASGAFVLLMALLALLRPIVLPRLEYARSGWRVQPDRVEAWRGIFFRRTISVPISRIQYVDLRQGPLERRGNIATLILHTAGTLSEAIPLPGLRPAVAQEVRDWLLAKTGAGQTGADAV